MKYNNQEIEEQIYNKTRLFLEERGVKGWNMDQLAKESGLAKNTLYKIVGSKEDVITNIVLRDMKYIESQLKLFFADESRHGEVVTVVKLFAELFTNTHGAYLNEVLLEYPSSGKKIKENKCIMEERVISFLNKKIKQGTFKPECEAEVIYEILNGITIHFIKLGYYGDTLLNRLIVSYKYIIYGIGEK